MTIAKAIAQQSLKEVESGGLHWRIKRIKTKDLMRAGIASLVHLAPDGLLQGDMTDEGNVRQQLQASWTEKLSKMTDVQQSRLYDSLDAVVCAGICEVSSDGSQWEKIRFTLKDKEHNPDKGVLLVESLPNAVRQELAGEIQAHSRAVGGGEDAVATFR
tara:strand:- start:1686 stop:2162 length:477 start_codon:yes stop_codon:yes gene_type:complete